MADRKYCILDVRTHTKLGSLKTSETSLHTDLERYLLARAGTTRFPYSITHKMSPQ